MQIKTYLSAVALAAVGLLAAPAQAALSPGPGGAVCSVTDTTINATTCSGSWYGDNKFQDADVYAELSSLTGLGGWLEQAPDIPFVGGTSGTLFFAPPVDSPFAIALKAGNSFSLYYYDGASGVTSMDFVTTGAALGRHRREHNLAHATLYLTPVPEPETYALLLAGLAVVGFVAGRRRTS